MTHNKIPMSTSVFVFVFVFLLMSGFAHISYLFVPESWFFFIEV